MDNEYKKLLLCSRNQYNICEYDFSNFCISYMGAAWVLGLSIEKILNYVETSPHCIEYKLKLQKFHLSPPLLVDKLDYYAFVFMVVELRKEYKGEYQLIDLTWEEMTKSYSQWFLNIQKMLQSHCTPLKLVKEHFSQL